MNFTDWQHLVTNAGGDISQVDHGWLLGQYQSNISPAIVANQIRSGQAPRPVPLAQGSGRGVFSSGVYFCAHLLLWHGWLIIGTVTCLIFYILEIVVTTSLSSTANKLPEGIATFLVGSGFLVFMVPGFLGAAAMGSLFVVAGSYVKKNIHQFEN